MNHDANIFYINAHAESVRGEDYFNFTALVFVDDFFSFVGRKVAVEILSLVAFVTSRLAQLFNAALLVLAIDVD